MKRLLILLMILVVLIVGAAQFLLPGLISSKLESKIVDELHPASHSLQIDSSPSAKMLLGNVDMVKGSLGDIKLGNLLFSELRFDVTDLTIDPMQLVTAHEVQVTHVGEGTIEGAVTEEALLDFLKNKMKSITVKEVTISKGTISLVGDLDIGGFLTGEVKLKGMLELKDNALVFAPHSLALNGFSIGGLTAAVLKEIRIYDFVDFPIPVKTDKIEVQDGKVHVMVKPIAK